MIGENRDQWVQADGNRAAVVWLGRTGVGGVSAGLLLWVIPLVFLAVFLPAAAGHPAGIADGRAQPTNNLRTEPGVGRAPALLLAGAALYPVDLRSECRPVCVWAVFPGKSLRVLTTLPFMMPTVVVAYFNAMLGSNGWLNQG